MKRRTFLNRSGRALLLMLWPRQLFASNRFRRRRPSDVDWPSVAAWKRLGADVEGNLLPVEFPLAACVKDVDGAACKELISNIKNPYFIGDHPALTQTLGWVDAWFTKPSVYAVAAKNAVLRIKASSDETFRALLNRFVNFYREQLFNDHWGESVSISPQNVLAINMVSYGLSTEAARQAWKPFLDWIDRSKGAYSIPEQPIIISIPARRWWDVDWHKQLNTNVFVADSRSGASSHNVWWRGDAGQVAWTIYGYESLWLPAELLQDHSRERLANALFSGSRQHAIGLHFNKGLAGAPAETIDAVRDTATNPAVLNAFALAIVADGEGGYPGVRGHEPDTAAARKARAQISRCMDELRAVTAIGGAYVSESNYFEKDWQHAYWGSNYERLLRVKKKHDPDSLFFVHNGVGTEGWSADGFTKL